MFGGGEVGAAFFLYLCPVLRWWGGGLQGAVRREVMGISVAY